MIPAFKLISRIPVQGVQLSSYRLLSSLRNSYDHILASKEMPPSGGDDAPPNALGVGVITLNRPKALNALCDALFEDLIHAATAFNEDEQVGSIIITGKGKAFAAGADIEEMSQRPFDFAYKTNMFEKWAQISELSKPVIAAVNGFCLGGGCELAMMCDIIICSESAKFGQPEINLGVIPGAGGTQRLVRAIGKSKAMELVLTGNMISAEQAEKDGLVSRVVKPETLLDDAMKLGFVIGSKGQLSIRMAKEAINAADDMPLEQVQCINTIEK
jgi:enoyl-CoA hydratase